MITLYKKTHNVTGLNYFGKTTRTDIDKYTGSGLYWKRHFKKHGKDIKTESVFQSDDINEISNYAIKYSNEHDIVNSNEWANLKEELGTDGGSLKEWYTKEVRKKMSENRKGKVGRPTGWKHTEEAIEKMSIAAKKRGAPVGAWKKGQESLFKGKKHTPESVEKMKNSLKNQAKYTCEHCGKEAIAGNFTRWHGNNCKHRI
jgi:rubrerythrin